MRLRRVRTLLIGLAMVLAIPFLETTKAAYAEADGCDVGVESDFNGDGRTDTVVADPYATVNGQAEAGRVNVLYGDADGLVGEGARSVVYQGSANVGGIAESGDRFGFSVAVADIDCDEYTDLVVGTPYEDLVRADRLGLCADHLGCGGGLVRRRRIAEPRPVERSALGLACR